MPRATPMSCTWSLNLAAIAASSLVYTPSSFCALVAASISCRPFLSKPIVPGSRPSFSPRPVADCADNPSNLSASSSITAVAGLTFPEASVALMPNSSRNFFDRPPPVVAICTRPALRPLMELLNCSTEPPSSAAALPKACMSSMFSPSASESFPAASAPSAKLLIMALTATAPPMTANTFSAVDFRSSSALFPSSDPFLIPSGSRPKVISSASITVVPMLNPSSLQYAHSRCRRG
ncbi:hypothetical protein D3C84_712520 [compost metagenome]